MNILSKVTWQAMKKNRTRTAVTVVGVILSAAMFMAVVTLGLSLRDYLLRGTIYENGNYYVRFAGATDEQRDRLASDSRVSSLGQAHVHGFFSPSHPGSGDTGADLYPLCSGDQTFFDSVSLHLTEGRLPENSRELLLSQSVRDLLEDTGTPAGIGDTLTLSLFTDSEALNFDHPETEYREFSATYTVVGIMENVGNVAQFYSSLGSTVLTFADGGEPAALWHSLYARTHNPEDAYQVISRNHGTASDAHTGLLMLLGFTQYSNMNLMFAGVVAILAAIIMVGSVSLIYNAFSISVSERTRQFGILASVGATRKQLRRSVFFEAGMLCLMGIPLGLVCGWAGIALVLKLLEGFIQQVFSYGPNVPLNTVVSPPGLLCAALTGTVTVFLSAAIPAGRATRVSPVAAIRQTGDYVPRPKDVRVGKLTYRLFGLPGAIAKKYYSVSRKKYRSTVVSLAISVVLFLSATAFGVELRVVDGRPSNYDFVGIDPSLQQLDSLQQLAAQAGIRQAVWCGSHPETVYTVVSQQDLGDAYREFHLFHNTYEEVERSGYLLPDLGIEYIQDDVLEAWLRSENIDPAPYLDPEEPLALVVKLTGTMYTQDSRGRDQRVELYDWPVTDAVDSLILYPNTLRLPEDSGLEDCYERRLVTADGRPYIQFLTIEEFTGHKDPTSTIGDPNYGTFLLLEQGDREIRAYRYDPATDTAETEPYLTQPISTTSVRLGARVESCPLTFGYEDFYRIKLILPLSAAPEGSTPVLGLEVDPAAAEQLRSFIEKNGVVVNDYLLAEQQLRGTLLVIDVFSYGFIILISAICVANVFNTISTNIALRRRDFGMLRSVGLKTGEMYRMMHFECLIYGSRALLWGLPLGLLTSLGIHEVFVTAFSSAWAVPWAAVLIASGSVFLVVFATMFYAVRKLKRDNPIEAIRMDNL